jgi:hypothetical protein
MSPQFGGGGLYENIPEGQLKFLKSSDSLLEIIEVKTKHLEDVLDEVWLGSTRRIQLLKVDTEGSCLEIIKSLSFQKYTFDFISAEFGFGTKDEGVDFLGQHGYKLVASFNQNEVFRHEKA